MGQGWAGCSRGTGNVLGSEEGGGGGGGKRAVAMESSLRAHLIRMARAGQAQSNSCRGTVFSRQVCRRLPCAAAVGELRGAGLHHQPRPSLRHTARWQKQWQTSAPLQLPCSLQRVRVVRATAVLGAVILSLLTQDGFCTSDVCTICRSFPSARTDTCHRPRQDAPPSYCGTRRADSPPRWGASAAARPPPLPRAPACPPPEPAAPQGHQLLPVPPRAPHSLRGVHCRHSVQQVPPRPREL